MATATATTATAAVTPKAAPAAAAGSSGSNAGSRSVKTNSPGKGYHNRSGATMFKKSFLPSMTEEQKFAISIISGLLITRAQVTTLKDIEKEYVQMEKQPIPFANGYSSLIDFLKATNKFHLTNNKNGEVIISLALRNNSERDSNAVSKAKKPLSFESPKRHIPRSSESNNWRLSNNHHNATATSLAHKPRREDAAGDTPLQWRNQNNNNNNKEAAATAAGDLRALLNKRNGHEQQQQQFGMKPNSNNNSKGQEFRSASLLMRQSSNESNNINLNHNNNNNVATTKECDTNNNNVVGVANKLGLPVNTRPNALKIEMPTPKKSIQHRLQIRPPTVDSSHITSPRSENNSASSSFRTLTPPATPTTPSTGGEATPTGDMGDPIARLKAMCEALKITDLKYEYWRKGDAVRCRATVNNMAHSSYPEECQTEHEAQVIAAKNALAQLYVEVQRKSYPMCQEEDRTVAAMIYDLLKAYPHGVLDKVIPEYFQRAYGQTVPEHWMSIVNTFSQYFLCDSGPSCWIVFAKEPSDQSSTSNAGAENLGAQMGQCEKLELPWVEKHWNLYVSNPATTTTIWARIIGDEYSNKMDVMMTDIEMAMISDQTKATVIELRKIYLVTASSCWYRVRCQQMDFENNRALCFFVDVGEEEWYPLDQIYVCESKFLQLPAQCVQFSLYGLEGFEDNPYAGPHLEKVLAGKTVVAEVLSKPEEYEESMKVRALLFDTSGEEDVNLVTQLLNDICEATPPPQLERSGVTHVHVCHISDEGDLYCQIRNTGIQYITKLIETVVANEEKPLDLHRGLANASGDGNRYLVYDRVSGKWYRAVLEEKRPHKDHKMLCIDYGFSKVIAEKDMYDVEPLSMALRKYPALAVKCRLYGIANLNNNVVGRMRALLATDTATLAKVIGQGSVPQVNLYKRLEVNNIMVCVNESIRMEQELEMSSLVVDDVVASNASSPRGAGANSPGDNHRQGGATTEIAIAAQSTRVKNLPLIVDLALPKVNSFFNVFVTLASNPFNFVVQPYDQRAEFHEMMRKLQMYCAKNNEFLTLECVEVGQYYAAQHADGKWLRATVERRFDSSIHVSFCDYGEIAVLSIDKLKMLPAEYRGLPKQAIKCRLFGIEPIHKDWTTHDCVQFNKLTVDKRFVSVIKGIRPDEFFENEKYIEVVLIDTNSEVDVNINEVLKNEGRAIAARN